MEQALRSAIYYIHGNDDSYLKYNIVTEILHDGTRENFTDIITRFRSDIQIRTLFGNRENICYEIADGLAQYYDTLLLGQLDTILIVTRHDNAIKLSRKSDNNNDYNYDLNIGIVKIDSVIAEININRISHSRRSSSWYKYSFWIGTIVALGFIWTSVYSDGLSFGDFYKND